MRQMALRMDDDLWARVESARGRVPRERFVRDLLVDALKPVALGLPGSTGGVSAVDSGTPVEMPARPADRVVVSAVRPFVPRPKGKS